MNKKLIIAIGATGLIGLGMTGFYYLNDTGFLEGGELLTGELIIYVGDDLSGSFEDGDIFIAANAKRMLDVNTQHIVKNRRALLDVYKANTMQYKFERISFKEVKRIDLIDDSYEIFSDIPNKDGEQIDVQLFISRRLKSPRHQIFGGEGSEYWYGGRTITTLDKLDIVWVEIEKQTLYKKADNLEYDFAGSKYIRIKVDDFDDVMRGELESPLLSTIPDETGIFPVLKDRKYKVDYKVLDLDVKHKITDILQTK